MYLNLPFILGNEVFLGVLYLLRVSVSIWNQIECKSSVVGTIYRQLTNNKKKALYLPFAPNFGCLWEAGVWSVKSHLFQVYIESVFSSLSHAVFKILLLGWFFNLLGLTLTYSVRTKRRSLIFSHRHMVFVCFPWCWCSLDNLNEIYFQEAS